MTATGAQVGATAHGLGGSGVGPSVVSAFAASGVGRVLKPNTKYLLRITNIDPLKYDLLFERFLNPERISMPDIDTDFCYRR